jgi:hypothetical protein
MRVWLESLGGFVLVALRPLRRLNAVLQEIGLPVIVVVVFLRLRANQGWASALVFALGIFVVLLLVEGTRREHVERSLRLAFEPALPEPAQLNPALEGRWKFSMRVTNLAGLRAFIARCRPTTSGGCSSSSRSWPPLSTTSTVATIRSPS